MQRTTYNRVRNEDKELCNIFDKDVADFPKNPLECSTCVALDDFEFAGGCTAGAHLVSMGTLFMRIF